MAQGLAQGLPPRDWPRDWPGHYQELGGRKKFGPAAEEIVRKHYDHLDKAKLWPILGPVPGPILGPINPHIMESYGGVSFVPLQEVEKI